MGQPTQRLDVLVLAGPVKPGVPSRDAGLSLCADDPFQAPGVRSAASDGGTAGGPSVLAAACWKGREGVRCGENQRRGGLPGLGGPL